MKKDKFIVLDTETTGFSPTDGDEMLQLTIIDSDGKILFNEYFKPERKTKWISAMAVNGITPEFVADKKGIKNYLNVIQEIFDSVDCIVGYNTEFDLGFLKVVGINIDENKQIIDVMRDFAEVYGECDEQYGNYKWQKLTKCAEYYNFDWNSTGTHAHDSLGDCFATLHCYLKMKEDMPKKVTMAWKVYGREGHRQAVSFQSSFVYDFSTKNDIRIIEVLNSDKTGTNDYSIIRITRNTKTKCKDELSGQITDGIFENYNVGGIVEIEE